MKRSMVGVVLASLVFLLVGAKAGAESALDFTLVNKTGYPISRVYVSPSRSDQWGSNILNDELDAGERVLIRFRHRAERVRRWDLMVTFDDGSKVYWRGYKLSDIRRITLHYNRHTNRTTAVTD